MKLTCLTDTCPLTAQGVDMRVCCGKRHVGKSCCYYGATAWSEFGSVTCNHPQAAKADTELAEARRETFRQTAGMGHLLYCT